MNGENILVDLIIYPFVFVIIATIPLAITLCYRPIQKARFGVCPYVEVGDENGEFERSSRGGSKFPKYMSEHDMIKSLEEMYKRIPICDHHFLYISECEIRIGVIGLLSKRGLNGITFINMTNLRISKECLKMLLDLILNFDIMKVEFCHIPAINLFPGEIKAIIQRTRSIVFNKCEMKLSLFCEGECYPSVDSLFITEMHPVENFPPHMNQVFPNLRSMCLEGLGLRDIDGFSHLHSLAINNNKQMDLVFWVKFLQRYMEFPALRRIWFPMVPFTEELMQIYCQFLSHDFKTMIYLWVQWDGLPKDLIRQLGLYVVNCITTN